MAIDQTTKPAELLNVDTDNTHDVHEPVDEPVMSDITLEEEQPLDYSSATPVAEPDTRADKTGSVPVPAFIKFGLPALIVGIFIVAGIGINFFMSNNKDVDPTPSFDGGDFQIGGAPIQPGAHAPAMGAPAILSRDEQLSSIESDVDNLRLLISSLQKNNAELQNQIDATSMERNEQIADLRSRLMDATVNTIPSLASIDKEHASTLNTLQTQIKTNKRRIDQATKRKAESPPFTLISIDEWGSTTSAVLEMDGKSTVASVGDVRAGWKITKIKRPDCIYATRVADNKSVTICGAGIL
ncbi:MAG: hypothetical protein L3K25_07560 [Gammaproteobacteria bacterium]|nr:hypothetical protein [Gammaproteobacteria bacterium]